MSRFIYLYIYIVKKVKILFEALHCIVLIHVQASIVFIHISACSACFGYLAVLLPHILYVDNTLHLCTAAMYLQRHCMPTLILHDKCFY